MTTAERLRNANSAQEQSSPSSSSRSGTVRKSLITDEPWDRYHLESLLPLKETFQENKEFGFLIRHYWIPATILHFRQTSRTTFPDGTVEQRDSEIERKMARCRSNDCLWREKTHVLAAGNGNGVRSALAEALCSYDCYEQTFHSAKPILFAPPTPDQKTEARRQALYRLPILVPPGPVPIGFCWYAKVDNDYMNYRIDAEERLGGTSVLVIRREGRYTVQFPQDAVRSESGAQTSPVLTERQGVTLFAWNRGAVLEDRVIDRVVDSMGRFACRAGTTIQVVTRLIRSCPETTTAEPVRPSAGGGPR